MGTFSVHVKWGKQKFSDVELNQDESPELFQAQLFALSGVPPERQKVMAKGKTLKSNTWEGFNVKTGMTLLMMGSADALPTAPVQKTKFVEDMSESEISKACNFPAGLNNLGNTCYMNATVQCLRAIPEVKDSLMRYNGQLNVGNIMSDPSEAITISLRDLYKMMDRTSDGIPPIVFLQVLHTAFPHFAEKTEQGVFQQQDANECWTQLVRMLQQKLPAEKSISMGSEASHSPSSLIDQYLGIDFETTMQCDEAPEEPKSIASEKQYQFSCFISQDVKYMHTGLRLRLKETITKASPTLGKDALYTKTSLISRLPAYLTIQFVRFYYKEKEKVNAKILKDVKFPFSLDVFDLCTPALQEKLQVMRDRFEDEREKNLARKIAAATAPPMETDAPEPPKPTFPYSFEGDIGSNNSGYYELSAVLTHRGRSSSSGHYVGWVKQSDNTWVMCDDDNMSVVPEEEVLKLSGGGDWHCAYVLLYAPKQLSVIEEVPTNGSNGSSNESEVKV
jgi:ubiquitin carboxyl-terminal hydrolase 14